MKHVSRVLVAIFLTVLSALSCKPEPMVGISSSRDLSFKADGGNENVIVVTNNDWTANVSEEWVTLSPLSGSANKKGQNVLLTCAPNDTYNSRDCEVTISSCGLIEKIHVRQEKLDAILVEEKSYNITYDGGCIETAIETNLNDIEVYNSDAWMLIDHTSTKGLHKERLLITVYPNPTYEARTGNITLRSKSSDKQIEICVIQDAKPPINLSSDGTANCYVVPLSDDVFSIDASVKGNTTVDSYNYSPIEGGVRAVIVWQYEHKGYSGRIIDNLKYDKYDKRITFSTNHVEGNALIAVKDINDKILWSWHLWVTNYDPNEHYITFSNDIVLQDRYLGAFSDEEIGLYYQWGRKDPFSSSIRYNMTTPDKSNCTVEYSTSHPDTFISAGYDKTYWDWNNEHTATWNSNKTMHDPCPPGWKVMDGKPFCIPSFPEGYDVEYRGYCVVLSEPICYPETKFRTTGLLHSSGGIQGTLSHVSVWANYGYRGSWYFGRSLSVRPDMEDYRFTIEDSGRTYGQNVRCQRE